MPEGELAFSDESELAGMIRKALGVGPYEKINAVTPQFERDDGVNVMLRPESAEQLDKIKKLPLDIQKRIGLQAWSKEDDCVLMLFPAEWYKFIPTGYPIVTISGQTKVFIPGETSNEIRFGTLAYGWMIKEIA